MSDVPQRGPNNPEVSEKMGSSSFPALASEKIGDIADKIGNIGANNAELFDNLKQLAKKYPVAAAEEARFLNNESNRPAHGDAAIQIRKALHEAGYNEQNIHTLESGHLVTPGSNKAPATKGPATPAHG